MSLFFKIGAWLFHPLLMPLLGVLIYFYITPRFFFPEQVYSKLIVVFILTFLIPVILIFFLKTTELIKSIQLHEVSERKYPLMIQCLLLVLLIKVVFTPHHYSELYFFFLAVLISTITAFILVLIKFKVSLHIIGITGLTMFLIALSVHFKINVLLLVGLLLFISGWVASSRLHSLSHTPIELMFGAFIGTVPQILVLNYWL